MCALSTTPYPPGRPSLPPRSCPQHQAVTENLVLPPIVQRKHCGNFETSQRKTTANGVNAQAKIHGTTQIFKKPIQNPNNKTKFTIPHKSSCRLKHNDVLTDIKHCCKLNNLINVAGYQLNYFRFPYQAYIIFSYPPNFCVPCLSHVPFGIRREIYESRDVDL